LIWGTYIEAGNIPVNSDKEIFRTEPVEIDGKEFKVTCVSMGNPMQYPMSRMWTFFLLKKSS